MTRNDSQDDPRLAAWHGCMDGEDTPPTDTDTLQPDQQRQLADEQLLHALLRHHYCESESSDARRVDRVLRSITPRPARPLWFRLTQATLSSAAALVLVMILIQMILPQTTSATPDFNLVVDKFLNDGDRAYSIQFAMQGAAGDTDPGQQTAPQRHSPPNHPRGGGKLNGATLYLRGAKQYVFEIKLPRDRTIWIGHNGQNTWMVCPNGTVLINEERDAFHLPFLEEMITIPLIDVRDTLQAARQGYTLEPLKTMSLEDGREMDYFVARREGQAGRRPQRIELWADPKTDVLQRMICSRMHFGNMFCRQLRMDYLNGKSLPAKWFEFIDHAPKNPKVKSVTKQDLQRFRRQHYKRRQERWQRQPHHRPWPSRSEQPHRFPSPPPPAVEK